jgi:molybdopterin converting factor subunit 1
MRLRVLFFGMLKDLVGRPADEIELPDGTSLGAVFERYASRHPRLRELAPSIVAARNQEFAERDTLLADGDEVAFLPPVSGGSDTSCTEIESGGHYFALKRCPIDTREVIARILTGGDGGVVTFEGVVRNNTKGRRTLYLDYECYEAMALKMIAKIGCEIAGAHAITHIAIVHRLGRMLIGETSVAVIVTAPHRRAAFDASLEGINRLKKLVPIWKKEHFADGEVWVEGEWDQNAPAVG